MVVTRNGPNSQLCLWGEIDGGSFPGKQVFWSLWCGLERFFCEAFLRRQTDEGRVAALSLAVMDSIFGFQGQDYVVLGTDCSAQMSIIRLKDDESKIFPLDERKLLACAGESSDRSEFANLIQKNVQLHYYRNGYSLNTFGTAQYIRSFLAESIRSRRPYSVNALLAGVDPSGVSLYYVDYLGTLDQLKKGAHGYAGALLYGLMDNQWRPVLVM